LINAIEAKLDDGTHGLAALRTLINNLEFKLDNGTYGLNALHTHVHNTETMLINAVYGLVALNIDLDNIISMLSNATYGLSALNTDLDTLLSRLTAARAGYLDNLNIGENVAGSSQVDEVEPLLKNATYGLAALNTDLDSIIVYVDEVESLLKNATYGLDALHTHLTSIENTLLRNISCMTFLSTINAQIDLPAAAADTNLPDVVISGIPTGATLDKVLVFLIVRAIQNTNAGGANAIEGAQNIRVKKSTGAWGVDDIIAIPLTDNMWTVAASTREFGDVIGGDDAHDVKSEVDGNATYNLRFEDANVDLDFLRLNDVQVMIKVWYH